MSSLKCGIEFHCALVHRVMSVQIRTQLKVALLRESRSSERFTVRCNSITLLEAVWTTVLDMLDAVVFSGNVRSAAK